MEEDIVEKLERNWKALPAAYKAGIISAFLIFSAGIAIDQARRYEKYKALANEVYSIADTSGNQKIERKEAKELSSENDCWTYFTKKSIPVPDAYLDENNKLSKKVSIDNLVIKIDNNYKVLGGLFNIFPIPSCVYEIDLQENYKMSIKLRIPPKQAQAYVKAHRKM